MTSQQNLSNSVPVTLPTLQATAAASSVKIRAGIAIAVVLFSAVLYLAGFLMILAWRESDTQAAYDATTFFDALGFLMYFAIAVFFMIWSYKAQANLNVIGRENVKNTPGSAVWSWFVPFVNLVLPFKIMLETIRGSHAAFDDKNWKKSVIPAVLPLWIVAFYVRLGAVYAGPALLNEAETYAALQNVFVFYLWSYVVIIAALGITIWLIASITTEQRIKLLQSAQPAQVAVQKIPTTRDHKDPSFVELPVDSSIKAFSESDVNVSNIKNLNAMLEPGMRDQLRVAQTVQDFADSLPGGSSQAQLDAGWSFIKTHAFESLEQGSSVSDALEAAQKELKDSTHSNDSS